MKVGAPRNFNCPMTDYENPCPDPRCTRNKCIPQIIEESLPEQPPRSTASPAGVSRAIGQIQMDGILQNRSTKETIQSVLAVHPSSDVSKGMVAWYRTHLIHDTKKIFVQAREGYRFDPSTRTWVPKSDATRLTEARATHSTGVKRT